MTSYGGNLEHFRAPCVRRDLRCRRVPSPQMKYAPFWHPTYGGRRTCSLSCCTCTPSTAPTATDRETTGGGAGGRRHTFASRRPRRDELFCFGFRSALLFRSRRSLTTKKSGKMDLSPPASLSPFPPLHSLTTLAAGGEGGRDAAGGERERRAGRSERAGWRNLCPARSLALAPPSLALQVGY